MRLRMFALISGTWLVILLCFFFLAAAKDPTNGQGGFILAFGWPIIGLGSATVYVFIIRPLIRKMIDINKRTELFIIYPLIIGLTVVALLIYRYWDAMAFKQILSQKIQECERVGAVNCMSTGNDYYYTWQDGASMAKVFYRKACDFGDKRGCEMLDKIMKGNPKVKELEAVSK